MRKEEMLQKAYNHALNNPALILADITEDVDRQVMALDMRTYADKAGFELSEADIEHCLDTAFADMDNMVKDFTYQTKIMQ